MLGEAREDLAHLRRSFALSKDDFGHACTQSAMMIHLGESEIFERQMTQAFDGVIGRKFAAADLIEKFTDGVGVHGGVRNQLASSRLAFAAYRCRPRGGLASLGSALPDLRPGLMNGVASRLVPASDRDHPQLHSCVLGSCDRAKFGNHSGADFVRESGLIQVNEEQAPQGARFHLARKAGVVDLVSDAVSPVLHAAFKSLPISPARLLFSFSTRLAPLH